jgi:hypothetical protein
MAGIVLGYGYKILLIGICAGISLHSFVLEMQGILSVLKAIELEGVGIRGYHISVGYKYR